MLAAVDLETTGRLPGYHEIIEMAVVPLDGSPPFHRFVYPQFPERQEAGALEAHGVREFQGEPFDTTADWLHDWIGARRLVMISHNLPFEAGFLTAGLGCDRYSALFSAHSRCTLQMALDRGFQRVGLATLCRHFGITIEHKHSALYDAIAGAELYRRLVKSEG